MAASASAEPAPEPGVDDGVAFPLVDGSRGTSATGRGVFADAARAVDAALAEQIGAERDWRGQYLVHARRLLEAEVTGREEALAVPYAGLASLHDRMVFLRDGQVHSLAEACRRGDAASIDGVEVAGEATGSPGQLRVPYRGARLEGDALHRQLDRWVDVGTVEPSFAEAVRLVMANPDWLDFSDRTVVVLGAGAEMGPLHSLAEWGAHVVPVDLARPPVWERILAMTRRGRGRATVPVLGRAPASPGDAELARVAGVDLVAALPELADWLSGFDGPLTLGNYAYADGATHVRVSMAADALAVDLAARHHDLSLAVLATPTDVFAVPADAVAMAQKRFGEAGLVRGVEAAVRGITGGRLFAPNYTGLVTTREGVTLGVADSLVRQQGQNYALAKRLQRWRATVARETGHVTSVNVAAPTRTRSVLRNRALAAAYAGARRFGVEVFDPSTSNTLMAALLAHDLRNPHAVAAPTTGLDHPSELFTLGANHGGLWRIPFAPRSAFGLAVVAGMVQRGA